MPNLFKESNMKYSCHVTPSIIQYSKVVHPKLRLPSCLTTFTHLTTISLALHVDHGDTETRKVDKGGPHTRLQLPLPLPDLNMQIDFIVLPESHLSRRWTLGKLQSLRHVRVVRVSMSKSVVVVVVGPKGDWTFVLHILGQILAHNSILHATAGSKFLRVQVASFSITLHRTPPSPISACTTGHDHRQLQAAKGFSLSPVCCWLKLCKIYCQINGDLYVAL